MSPSRILSLLVNPQSGYLFVYHMGLSLFHCSYLSIGSLQLATRNKEAIARAFVTTTNQLGTEKLQTDPFPIRGTCPPSSGLIPPPVQTE